MHRSPPSSVSPPRPGPGPPGRRAYSLSLAPPAAAPPPMMPLMPCLAMKSSARGLALTTGCQHSTGNVFGQRHQRDLPHLVPAIRHGRRDRVVLALVREGALVERLEDDLDLLLEQLAVGVAIEHRRPEALDLAGVIAASAEHHAAVGQPVGRGVVLGHPDRMPHRRDVEAAADPDVLGDVAEVQRQHQHVGDALVAFALEVVLGEPVDVVAGAVHQLGDGFGLGEHRGQVVVGQPALVHRCPGQPLVVEIDVAREQAANVLIMLAVLPDLRDGRSAPPGDSMDVA